MRLHARVWVIASSLSRRAISVLLVFLFPSWYGRNRKYRPQRYYSRTASAPGGAEAVLPLGPQD